jgi:hypothetical protein
MKIAFRRDASSFLDLLTVKIGEKSCIKLIIKIWDDMRFQRGDKVVCDEPCYIHQKFIQQKKREEKFVLAMWEKNLIRIPDYEKEKMAQCDNRQGKRSIHKSALVDIKNGKCWGWF